MHLKRTALAFLSGKGPARLNLSARRLQSVVADTKQTVDFVSRLKTFPDQTGSVDLNLFHETATAVVTINNPKSKNALSAAMLVDVLQVVHELEQWHEGKAVILKGSNDFFCAGADLVGLMAHLTSPEGGMAMCQYMQDVTTRFRRLPLISVAAIQGAAIGGGAELSTMCDFRLMSPDAKIHFVQKRIGVTPGWGGGSRLVKIVGRRKALELLAGSYAVEFGRAEEIGLVDGHLSNCKEPALFCTEWLERSGLLTGNAAVIQSIKRLISVADDYSMDIALAHERDVFGKCWGSKELTNKIKQHSKSTLA